MLVLGTELKALETQEVLLTIFLGPQYSFYDASGFFSQAALSSLSGDSLIIIVGFQPLWECCAYPGMPGMMFQIYFSLRRKLQVIFLGMSPEKMSSAFMVGADSILDLVH